MKQKIIAIDGKSHKQCTSKHGCGEWLPLSEYKIFTKREKLKSGEIKKYPCYMAMCRSCERIYKSWKNRKFRVNETSYAYHTAHRIDPQWRPVFAGGSA